MIWILAVALLIATGAAIILYGIVRELRNDMRYLDDELDSYIADVRFYKNRVEDLESPWIVPVEQVVETVVEENEQHIATIEMLMEYIEKLEKADIHGQEA